MSGSAYLEAMRRLNFLCVLIQVSGETTGCIMEKLLEKIDQSQNPELYREISKNIAALGVVGMCTFIPI